MTLIQIPKKVLIVEDEASVAGFIKTGLEDEGYSVTLANNGNTGWKELQANAFDLILLDIRMPGMDGLTLCKKIREEQKSQTPVIMLTALNETSDVIYGLDIGADDYVSKPFKFSELTARMRALLRRSDLTLSQEYEDLTYSDLRLNRGNRMAVRGDKNIRLTTKEFVLLEFFMLAPEKVHDRKKILKYVWGLDHDINTNVVDVYMNFLRNKVDKGFAQRLLHTVVGAGYMLRVEDDN
jgi:two-component system, OmpR family, copper resistance phosphate regulon response regulator CusR